MLSKEIVYDALKSEVQSRGLRIEKSLADSLHSMTNETKSSAGDKHETGRAMAQLEQEKLSGQIATATKLKGVIARIDAREKHDKIQFGSLALVNENWYFFSVGIGLLDVNGTKVFCLSAVTPIGKLLVGKSKGDAVSFNGKEMKILEVL
jgi:transcription elongation GreA/GreB family factor